MKTTRLLSILAVVTLIFAACSTDNAKKVADKINAGESLTEADYGVMIDYCGQYATEAQKYQNQIDLLPDTSSEATKDVEELAALGDSYPYLDMFNSRIASATRAEVGEANVAKINKYAALIWFEAPEWATEIDNRDVDGFVEDMPAQSADSAVISTGEGVAVGK